jgi:hypothetical protein
VSPKGRSEHLFADEMSIEPHPYSEADGAAWDEFIDQRARNGTFLHSRRFLRHNPANARDDASIVFRKRGHIVGVLPAARIVAADGVTVLHSHPRSTYGGFVVGDDVGCEDVLAMVDGAIAHAAAIDARRVVVRNPFRIFHAAPTDESDYGMWLRGFELLSREIELAVPLCDADLDAVLARFDGKTRNQTRKAYRMGVAVSESEDVAEFWSMLEANLAARHQTAPTHRLDEFLRLRELVGPDAVRLFAATHEGRMVAGMVVFVVGRHALHAQYIASRADALHLCPVNAVIHHVMSWGASLGRRVLNLGLSTENGGRTMNAGLVAFKEGFGAHAVLRETMTLTVGA